MEVKKRGQYTRIESQPLDSLLYYAERGGNKESIRLIKKARKSFSNLPRAWPYIPTEE